ncbi:MAG: hypothetical protein MZU95_03455 [Desulfomicrobium escambiense]|nr:hypothetical protein [Desulfomicrobium escambiense]
MKERRSPMDLMDEPPQDGLSQLDVSEKVKSAALGPSADLADRPRLRRVRAADPLPDRGRQMGCAAGLLLPGDPLRHRRPPRAGGHRPEPHQRLDHPGLGPGAFPVSAEESTARRPSAGASS